MNHIRLEEKIGHSAQAEVFKAKCGLDDVVVKRFLDSTHKDTKHEIEIIKQLRHRYIVQFYHVQQDMLVMEYVEGGSLADAIAEEALKTWKVKTQIAKDISLGLAYLHSLGIIHCDIKSTNILITTNKEARICDFGKAWTADGNGGGGTLQWMAPELLQDPPKYSSKSDVYALGMVMWEMASGSTQPYQAHTPNGIVQCIQNAITEEYPANTPRDYANCMQMCWRQVPQERPAAVDVLPDIGHSSQGLGAQELISAENRVERTYYLRALEQYVKSNDFPALKLGHIYLRGGGGTKKSQGLKQHDGKTMEWLNTIPSGNQSAAAMFNIGSVYYYGRGVEQDYGKALEWYLAAGEVGVAVAMLKVSEMYQHGHGVEQDDSKAVSWYIEAQKAIEEQGKINNGMVHHDICALEHHRGTMEWFRNSVGGGPAAAMFNIGGLYQDGCELGQNYNKAMEWYLKASDAGHAAAMSNIGFLYRNGLGVDQDYGKALEWYLKASDAGDADALYYIGALYCNGLGVDQDYGKALEWYLKASDAGDSDAMHNVGVLYCNGLGVEQDYSKALEWYLKAGDAGNADAMFNVGVFYDNGLGVEQDYSKALEWYLKASDTGDADAMCNIGHLYRNGLGVEQDYDKALEWYIKASDAGVAMAMLVVGDMYRDGKDAFVKDHNQAKDWYLKARDAGVADASDRIKGVSDGSI
ncbi:hypothetical protein BGX28_000690 [Mortierella sp. GBA30]|nr:hypothetical protein BGX28_000690 [Mortierella sp. GBA30]